MAEKKKTLRLYTYTFPSVWDKSYKGKSKYRKMNIKASNKKEAMIKAKKRFSFADHYPQRLEYLGTENIGSKIRLGFLQKDALAFAYKENKNGKSSVSLGSHNNNKDVWEDVSVETFKSLAKHGLIKEVYGYRYKITEKGKNYYKGKVVGTYRGDKSYGNKYKK